MPGCCAFRQKGEEVEGIAVNLLFCYLILICAAEYIQVLVAETLQMPSNRLLDGAELVVHFVAALKVLILTSSRSLLWRDSRKATDVDGLLDGEIVCMRLKYRHEEHHDQCCLSLQQFRATAVDQVLHSASAWPIPYIFLRLTSM